LGNGSLLGYSVFGEAFQPWVVMILPPGGFFVLGGWLLLFNWLADKKESKESDVANLSTQKGVS